LGFIVLPIPKCAVRLNRGGKKDNKDKTFQQMWGMTRGWYVGNREVLAEVA